MDSVAEKLVNFATTLSYDDLTPSAVHAVKRSVVDSIGCALGAFDAEPAVAVRNLATQVSAENPATVLGTTTRTSAELAALANGTMIRYSDFSDDYFGGSGSTGPHPSDNIGGVLAAAESCKRDVRAVILGIAIAYEASGQLIDHTTLGSESGWDYTVLHAISTSLAAANVMGLTAAQAANALGLAVVPNISLRETREGEISNWKALAGPNGSRNGLFAAQLAREGITGPSRPFEGTSGFMKQLDCHFELADLPTPGAAYKIEQSYFKAVPVRYTLQLPVWIAQELHASLNIDDVESVTVYITKRFAKGRDRDPEAWDPRTRETADHSAPYLIGSALMFGEINEETYEPERFRDPKTLALLAKINLLEDEEYTRLFPRTFKCRIEVALTSGEAVRLERTNPKGHPANPMTDDDLSAKFRRQAEPVLGSRRTGELLDLLWNLDSRNDLAEIFEASLVPESASS